MHDHRNDQRPGPGHWHLGHRPHPLRGRLHRPSPHGEQGARSFEKLSGTITVAPNLLDSAVHAEIDATSIRTGQDQRDAHLRSGDFFDTENHPNFIFQSTGVTQKGSDFELAGDLSIRGVSRPVVLALEFNGVGPNSQGGQHAGFSATTEISRKDYGVEFNIPLEGGGVTIGDKVTINLEIAADLQA